MNRVYIYYSTGGGPERPVIGTFSLDATRLVVNGTEKISTGTFFLC